MWHPRRRRDPASTECPRGSRGVAATPPQRTILAAPAASPRPRRRCDPHASPRYEWVDERLGVVASHELIDVDEDGDPITETQRMAFVDEATCIGCTLCAGIAPQTFLMEDAHGRARVFSQEGDDEETISEAISTCPVSCIHFVPHDPARKNLLPSRVPDLDEISTSPQRRRRDSPPRNIHGAAAASPRLVSVEYPRRTRGVAATRPRGISTPRRWDELVRLESAREGVMLACDPALQKSAKKVSSGRRRRRRYNPKGRLVGNEGILSMDNGGAGQSMDISTNSALRCNNCPTNECVDCPMFGIGDRANGRVCGNCPTNGCPGCPLATEYPEFSKIRARRDRKRRQLTKARQEEAREQLGLSEGGGGVEL